MRVDELKNKILQLAIQGKLVPQDDNDIPASVLLEEIKKEKEQLIKEKKIKREKPLPEITEEEKLFELPKGWEWVRLGSICRINPRNSIDDRLEVSFIPMTLLREGYFNNHEFEIRTWSDVKSGFTHFAENDVAFAKITPCFENRKSAIFQNLKNGVGAGTTELYVLRPYGKILPKFLFNIIISKKFIDEGKSTYTGTAGQQRIKKEFVENYIIALPSVAEQLRIVQKVDELFEIIDELSKNKETMLKNISNTRNKVLQLAIQGKLVEQKPEDTPVSVLLEEIRKEKETLIKEKKIKKEKALSEITEEEKPFEIPKGWEWVRFSQVLDVRDGTHDTPKYVEKGVPLITSKNINGKEIDFNNVKYISMEDHIEISKRSNVENGDILFAMIGSIGNPVIVNKKEEFSIKNVALFKFYKKNIVNNKFLYYYLLLAQNDMKSNSKGAVQSFVSLKILREYIFPLPSVAEQQRIVQKVDEIMAYLDELEKTIM